MKAVPVLASCLVLGCATSGPRPVPATASAEELVRLSEEASAGATGSAAFTIDADGAEPAHLTGTITLLGKDALKLTAEGRVGPHDTTVELDASQGVLSASVSRGPQATGNRRELTRGITEALMVGLVRFGLYANLLQLMQEAWPIKLEQGVSGGSLVAEAKDGEARDGAPSCRAVAFTTRLDGTDWGEASVCVATDTALPVERSGRLRTPAGLHTVKESFVWSVK